MALDAFMSFNPTKSIKHTGSAKEVAGETSDVEGAKHGSFEIISFEWGASSVKKEKHRKKEETSSTGGGNKSLQGMGASESSAHRVVSVGSFKVSKPFDGASPGLFSACIDTECVFKEASVLFRKTAGGKNFVYLMFVFGQVRVDSIDWKIEGADSTDKPDQEDLNFSFETCDIFYSPQTDTGEKGSHWTKGGDFTPQKPKKSASFVRTAGQEED